MTYHMVDQKQNRRSVSWRGYAAFTALVLACAIGPNEDNIWPALVVVAGLIGLAVWLLRGEK